MLITLKKMMTLISLIFLGFAASQSAQATLLLAGETIDVTATTFAEQPRLGGSVLHDEIIDDFAIIGGNPFFQVGVAVQNRVVRSTMTGELIFSPRIISLFNNTSGNFLIDSATIFGYSDFSLDVNYRTDGLGDRGPNQASRSADGDTLNFNFFTPLVVSNLFPNPQEDSYFFSLYSNATSYSLDGRMIIRGRHLDYPGESFTLSYANIAIPTIAQVSSPAIFVLFFCALVFTLRSKLFDKTYVRR
ncbi:hypothetical protein [Glaciecola petra]|uniref:PEP-CTERM sorting domain-containing protein n=1 Tax=Glaciecola petra TaxID=3075602 RepID=A0ABU2ZW65_9ALTE|nr:hypothetical protein [Aestuariibacter sp. P117]MDT0596486.1 hypothetical protein [Aestuariibacter sp. P117]